MRTPPSQPNRRRVDPSLSARARLRARAKRGRWSHVVLGIVLLTLACSGARAGAGRSSSNVITRAELSRQETGNAYEAVQRLRPHFLRSRGTTSIRNPEPSLPVVYVNGVRHGSVETLRSLPIQEVEEIRFVSASDATTRWGTGHVGGVIEVKLR